MIELNIKDDSWDIGWLLLFIYLDACMVVLGADLPESYVCTAVMILIFIIAAIATFSKEEKTRFVGFSIFFLLQIYLLAALKPSVGLITC